MEDRLMRLDEVKRLTGLPRSTIYSYIEMGKFPRQKGGMQRLALWRASEIQAWIASDTCYSEDQK